MNSQANPGGSNPFFTKHAREYAQSASHAKGGDLLTLLEDIRPKRQEIALDIATGTGFTAFELAGKVREVYGADITEEMISQAIHLARERGISNVYFQRCDAANLPYADGSFDLVTIRRATHHFQNLKKSLKEASRVLRSEGRLGIADMLPPQGVQEFFNRIEILRDRTHVKALTANEWRALLEDAQFKPLSENVISEEISFEQWFYPAIRGGDEEKAIREEWSKCSADTRSILKEKRDSEGNVMGWTRSWIVLTALKK